MYDDESNKALIAAILSLFCGILFLLWILKKVR